MRGGGGKIPGRAGRGDTPDLEGADCCHAEKREDIGGGQWETGG